MQLVEKLIRLRKTKYFDLMVYPAERHGFDRKAGSTNMKGSTVFREAPEIVTPDIGAEQSKNISSPQC